MAILTPKVLNSSMHPQCMFLRLCVDFFSQMAGAWNSTYKFCTNGGDIYIYILSYVYYLSLHSPAKPESQGTVSLHNRQTPHHPEQIWQTMQQPTWKYSSECFKRIVHWSIFEKSVESRVMHILVPNVSKQSSCIWSLSKNMGNN